MGADSTLGRRPAADVVATTRAALIGGRALSATGFAPVRAEEVRRHWLPVAGRRPPLAASQEAARFSSSSVREDVCIKAPTQEEPNANAPTRKKQTNKQTNGRLEATRHALVMSSRLSMERPASLLSVAAQLFGVDNDGYL